MLNEAIRILNFDDSVIKQKRLLEQYKPAVIDFKRIAPFTRLWLNKKIEKEIAASLAPEFINSVTFLGSGDFHHISSLLIQQFREPINLIIFDNHPDWDCLPPKIGCGSWVSRIQRLENVEKIILLGVSSEDISFPSILTGNLASLKDNRLEIYPFMHRPTRVLFKRVPENISINIKRGKFSSDIYWQELKGKDLKNFMLQTASRLKNKKVYVSIDKDCLASQYALANWEEGNFSLDGLLDILGVIKNDLDIVGLDIVGDYSELNIKSKIKSFFSLLDHPKNYSSRNKSREYINSVNEETNMKIMKLLRGSVTKSP